MAPVSIQSALDDATALLRQQSAPDSDREYVYDARRLLGFVLGASTSHLITHADQVLTCDQLKQYRELVDRRANQEPLAYLIGERGFWTFDVKVTASVLDPRPDTETLVHACLRVLDTAPRTVLDAGTGSGVIAGALVRERPAWHVFASDLSPDALRIAAENLAAPPVPLICADWLSSFTDRCLDVIVSNPPYLGNDDPHLNALRHEPRMALVADKGGLGAFAHIIEDARRVLKGRGWLILEHGYTQRAAVINLLRAAAFEIVDQIDDLAGNPRVVVARYVADNEGERHGDEHE